MKAETTISQGWDEIVFENRNKAYGAYFIRKVYSKNATIASIVALIIIALVLAFPSIAALFKSDVVIEKPKLRTTVSLEQPPPINPDQPPPPNIPPPPVKTVIKFLPPKVTDKEVVEEEEMPTIEEIKQNDVGAENVEGTGEVVFDEPVAEVAKEEVDEDVIFTVVEQQAEFPGGMEALVKFLQKNVKYPAIARRMGVEGSVFVSFVVDRAGAISDIQV